MTILTARPEVRRPKSLRVDLRHRTEGLRLAEAPDVSGTPIVTTGPTAGFWAGRPEVPSLWAETFAGMGDPRADTKGRDGVTIPGDPAPAAEPTTEAERVESWLAERLAIAYPDSPEDVATIAWFGRIWPPAGFDLAEIQGVIEPIIRGGCPACKLVDRTANVLCDRKAERDRRREAEAREKREAEDRQQCGAADAMVRHLLAEAAERFEQATATLSRATATSFEAIPRGDAAKRWDEVIRQAEDAKLLAEQALAYRLDDAAKALATGIETHDAGGDFVPFGMVVNGVVYTLTADVGDMRPGIIEAVRLDRIIGLG